MKKPKKSHAIQYLLNVDQRLKKISLRRISERLTKRPARAARPKNSVSVRSSTGFPWPMRSRAMVFGVMCVVAVAALITLSQSGSGPVAARAADVTLETAPSSKPVRTPSVQSAPKPAVVVPATQAATVESKAQAEVQEVAAVTVTGCLERDGVTFWLKDTSGMPDTPKGRSWRSGFLKKRPARVGVVSASNAVKLPNYVGDRVAATGAVMDGQMRARSLRRVAASCK